MVYMHVGFISILSQYPINQFEHPLALHLQVEPNIFYDANKIIFSLEIVLIILRLIILEIVKFFLSEKPIINKSYLISFQCNMCPNRS